MSECRRVVLKQVGFVLVLVAAASLLAWVAPEASLAALRGAAGGANGNAGGFARFVDFINRLAGYLVPVGAAFSVLGLIWGGMLFQAGDSRAGRVLALVALGLAIVLLSKPIAA
jgi:hypothetical protein